jgi:hypothetical protein
VSLTSWPLTETRESFKVNTSFAGICSTIAELRNGRAFFRCFVPADAPVNGMPEVPLPGGGQIVNGAD